MSMKTCAWNITCHCVIVACTTDPPLQSKVRLKWSKRPVSPYVDAVLNFAVTNSHCSWLFAFLCLQPGFSPTLCHFNAHCALQQVVLAATFWPQCRVAAVAVIGQWGVCVCERLNIWTFEESGCWAQMVFVRLTGVALIREYCQFFTTAGPLRFPLRCSLGRLEVRRQK